MTKIIWNAVSERLFETGIDRGVLYIDGQDGVPWNGLVSVLDNSTGGEVEPHYIDGLKYLNHASTSEFEASLGAFSKPKEFNQCEGNSHVQNGLYVAQQPKKSFGLSYRTLVGNDVSGTDYAYKIHLVYNAIVDTFDYSYRTLNDISDPTLFTWNIKTRAELFPHQIKPVSHVVLDTREMSNTHRLEIEYRLYGYEGWYDPYLPDFEELYEIFSEPEVSAPTPIDP